jgi:hypothetical protein
MRRCLRVDTARCLHETLDGDTIVIDAERGWLLVFEGLATTVWERMVGGADAAAIVAEAGERYGTDAATAVHRFVDELVGAGLLVPDHQLVTHDAAIEWPAEYVEPRIDRFDDVADILMMDPIHEVTVDRGWPNSSGGPSSDDPA